MRQQELLDGRPPILTFRGEPLADNGQHLAVLSLPLSNKNLQQCADTVLRLRAEFLRAQNKEVKFHLTNGEWLDLRRLTSERVVAVRQNKLVWKKRPLREQPGSVWSEYLDTLFLYAGTLSLPKDMHELREDQPIRIGDVIMQPGSPGHVVLVADKVEDDTGAARYLLVQGFMPAQQAHVLAATPENAWFDIADRKQLHTPSWSFEPVRVFRFK